MISFNNGFGSAFGTLPYTIICVVFFISPTSLYSLRNIHRNPDKECPHITAQWKNHSKLHILRHTHLELWPFFHLFDKQFFFSHQLPKDSISYRNNPNESVEGAHLNALLEQLVQEIKARKKKFTHFTVLRERNFNRRTRSGLIVLKFKDYPFVVKLFMENPESLVHPFDKGWEPKFFFFMSGGSDRHRVGFTRIQNLHHIQEQIAKSPYWSSFVDTPRKWFWAPAPIPWIKITGHNMMFNNTTATICIPGTYAIVADAINTERTLELKRPADRRLALSLCNYLDMCLDPHIDNFIIEKHTKKLVIVDTEHFPSMVGLKRKPKAFRSYTSWLFYLGRKCTQDMFFRSKKLRGRIGIPFDRKINNHC